MLSFNLRFSLFVVTATVLWCASNATAACTGSSPTWTSTPDLTSINTCISNATSGDTINVTAGSGTVTWASSPNFDSAKAINLIGPGAANLKVTTGVKVTLLCGAGKPHRLSGFTFTGSSDNAINVQGTCSGLRIDHNRITEYPNSSDGIVVTELIQIAGPLTNILIDHNTFDAKSHNFRGVLVVGSNSNNWPASPVGTANVEAFIEDNTFNYGRLIDVGAGCIDSNYTASYVWRFNTTRNCNVIAHGVCNANGTVAVEIYHNTHTADSGYWTDGYRSIHHQGSGEAYIFGNRIMASTGKSDTTFEATHYRSCPGVATGCNIPRCDGTQSIDGNTSGQQGYPCFHQIGRAGPGTTPGTLAPWYFADNLWSDNSSPVAFKVENPWSCTSPTPLTHVQANRDYYVEASGIQTSATSPFNGTSGTGWGTMANRPTTCTTGVGYWATDQGEWNSSHAGPDGQLYKCTATNTWSLLYTPYMYPHPLQSGSSTTTQLVPPTGFRVVSP
jgi:hypothetical protein